MSQIDIMVLKQENQLMRKVELNLKEHQQYTVIKKCVETNGNKKRAAIVLNCSLRHVNRLIRKFKEKGKEAFVHGNRGRSPSNKIDESVRNEILEIYCQVIPNANYRHATQLLDEHFNIQISDTSLNSLLKQNFILSPKAHRKTKKTMKKVLKNLIENSPDSNVFDQLDLNLHEIHPVDAHPRKPRSTYFGECIQMDASEYVWFGTQKAHLHLAIDDATGRIVGGYFDAQETLKGYYQVLNQILNRYGIPYQFLTDRRTIFEYKLKNAPPDEEDAFTQFSYACHQLGIGIETTSVPQAKGRIERLNGTAQSRLPVELKLKGITSIEQANQYLCSFIEKYNDQFALHLHDSQSVFEKQPNQKDIDLILAILSKRTIDNGHCIRYKNRFYIPTTSTGVEKYFPHRTSALMIEAFDGQLYVNIHDEIYGVHQIQQRHQFSKHFDEVKVIKPKTKYIPPIHHPWRIGTFEAFLYEQKHRNDGAHV